MWAWWPSQRLTLKSGHQERSRSHNQLIVYRKCNLVMTAKRSLSFLLSFKRERAVFQDLTFSILSTRDPRQHHRIKKKTLGARRLFPLLRRALTSGLSSVIQWWCQPCDLILWKGFLPDGQHDFSFNFSFIVWAESRSSIQHPLHTIKRWKRNDWCPWKKGFLW